MRPYQVSEEDLKRFIKERERFNLKYRCPDCVHFNEKDGSCSLEYPNHTLMTSQKYLDSTGQFVFCRFFEVW